MKHLLIYTILFISLCSFPTNYLMGQNYCLPDALQSSDFWAENIKIGNIDYNLQSSAITEGIPAALADFSPETPLDLLVNYSGELTVYVFIDDDEDDGFKINNLILEEDFPSGDISTVLTFDADLYALLQNEQRTGVIIVTPKAMYDDGVFCGYPFGDDFPQKAMLINFGPNPTNGPKYRISTTLASGKCISEDNPISFYVKNISGNEIDINTLELRIRSSAPCSEDYQMNPNFNQSELIAFPPTNVANTSFISPGEEWHFKAATFPNCGGSTLNAYVTFDNSQYKYNLFGYIFCTSRKGTGKSIINNDIIPPTISQINKVFPNPTSDNTVLEFEAVETGNATIEIYNIYGKLVQPIINDLSLDAGIYELTLPLNQLQNGTYFLLWRFNDKQQIEKIIKVK